MKALLLALALLCSGSLLAQVVESFDPGAYVQVELILFTRASQGQGTNRTGVQPERLGKQVPRRFPLELLSVRGVMLDQSQDISWFENEWALIEPQLIDLSEEELALGLLQMVEKSVLEVAGEGTVTDEGRFVHEEPFVDEEAASVDSSPVDELTTLGNQETKAAPSGDSEEALESPMAPEEIPLWQRYRKWYTELIGNTFSQLEAGEWKLRAALEAITSASDLQVIMHGAWIQPIGARPQAILLHGGEAGEVGVLRLRRGAFVQAEVLMWRPLAHSYAELNESRPMRLARAYYFDHPLMGLILRVDPIEVPREFR